MQYTICDEVFESKEAKDFYSYVYSNSNTEIIIECKPIDLGSTLFDLGIIKKYESIYITESSIIYSDQHTYHNAFTSYIFNLKSIGVVIKKAFTHNTSIDWKFQVIKKLTNTSKNINYISIW